MKKLCGYTLVIVACLSFVSCQKEADPTIPNSPQNDSTTLTKMIILDTTLPAGQDTIFILRFSYDAQKRKALEEFIEIDHTVGLSYLTSFHYKYNGTDTMPRSITEKYGFSTDSVKYYFSYSNGFIVKDSSEGYTGGIVTSIQARYFSLLGSNLYLKKNVSYDPSSGLPQYSDSTVYTRNIINGNLVSGRDSLWGSRGLPTLDQVSAMQFTFDNKTNPLAPLTVWYLGYYDNLDDMVHMDYGINNMLTSRYDILFPGTSSDFSAFIYTYNSSGSPVIIRSNGTDGNKGYYFYTKL